MEWDDYGNQVLDHEVIEAYEQDALHQQREAMAQAGFYAALKAVNEFRQASTDDAVAAIRGAAAKLELFLTEIGHGVGQPVAVDDGDTQLDEKARRQHELAGGDDEEPF